ncbi:MAG TPA: HD domain-containing protein, partial [Actinomycetota bacterium]|nr:HD domain-containing protein [Actinomycetota bacterium]
MLHGERREGRIRDAARSVFYPFWDAGIPLGHAVRTVRQCVALSRERLDAATAHLDARLVWGDEELFARLRDGVVRIATDDPGAFLARLEEDAAARLASHGSCSQLLEPDLKESVGGLRDVHALGWIARARGAENSTELVSRGLLRPGESVAVEDAEEFLIRLRSALHLETGRRRDRLVLEDQPAVARAFGFEATAGLDAPDALMRALFEHARQVEHVRSSLMERARGRPSRVGAPEPSDAAGVVRAFADAAEAAAAAGAELLEAAETAPRAEGRWPADLRRDFVRLLASTGGASALEAMDRVGFLPRLVPEWSAVRCRPQRDPYHRFTVDVHLVRTAERAARLLAGEVDDDPVLAAAAGGVIDRDAVVLGALLHDIGKRGAGPHVPVGVEVATEILDRMGVDGSTASSVRFLVGEHLLLSDTATRRDLSDENLVVDVAARVGDPERLAMLYVVTAADAMSTGPHAWSPWRQALIRELVGKVQHLLEAGGMDADRAVRLE